mgnify:CR=1 FL=1
MLGQQLGNPFKLGQETFGDGQAGLPDIEIERIGDVFFCAWVKRPGDRTRLQFSLPPLRFTRPGFLDLRVDIEAGNESRQ